MNNLKSSLFSKFELSDISKISGGKKKYPVSEKNGDYDQMSTGIDNTDWRDTGNDSGNDG